MSGNGSDSDSDEGAGGGPLAAIGSLKPFDPEKSTATEWLEIFEVYADYCKVFDEGERALLLITYLGVAHRRLRQACLPMKLKNKTEQQIAALLIANFDPPTLKRTYRRKLFNRVQADDENVTMYANALREIASKCDYDADHLETVLVDVFCRGVKSDVLKAKLDKQDDLDELRDAVAMGVVLEGLDEAKQERTGSTAAKVYQRGRGRGRGGYPQQQNRGGAQHSQHSQHFRGRGGFQPNPQNQRGGGGPSPRGSRGNFQNSRGRFQNSRGSHQNQTRLCYSCRQPGHLSSSCKYQNARCYSCNQVGHISYACGSNVKFVEGEEQYNQGENNEGVEDLSNLYDGEYIAKKIVVSEELRLSSEVKSPGMFKDTYVNCEDVDLELEACKLSKEIEDEARKNNDVKTEIESDLDSCVTEVCDVKCVSSNSESKPVIVKMNIDGKSVIVELDTGTKYSLMHVSQWRRLYGGEVKNTNVVISSLSGHSMKAVGERFVTVIERGRVHRVRLVLCDNSSEFMPLMGREWLDVLVPGWRSVWKFEEVKAVKEKVKSNVSNEELKELRVKYPQVFSKDCSSSISGFKASVVLKEGARPVFHKDYVMPYALRDAVNEGLRRKVEEGRYVRVDRSLWASPVWPIPKPNSSEVRIVHDYKRTVNPNIIIDHYPLPIPEDIFNALNGCKVYCVIDCADAYMQLVLDEKSQEILVLNTCIGLLKPTRLPYGLASASACFQSVIDQILFNVPKTKPYVDDIITGGRDLEECRKNLHIVLERLNNHNVRINEHKLKLFVPEVEFLGFVLGSSQYRPSPKKVKAIVECPVPVNKFQLKSFMGMVNFYIRFIPNASTNLKSLYALMSESVEWEWTSDCDVAFQLCKRILSTSPVLATFDPTQHIVLVCDASPVGVGAVLALRDSSGVERPVMFLSRSLNEVQQRYSQIEREALAIITALTKCNKFVWGRKFTLVTDNSALKILFAPDKVGSKVTALRLQRWAVILSNYSYNIEYRSTEKMGAADALSRLPLPKYAKDVCCNVISVPELPISNETVILETDKDPVLSQVKSLVIRGWPERCIAVDLKPYFDIRYALSIDHECIMFSDKVVIPQVLRAKILSLLHDGHPGMVRMKLKARAIVYWPEINKEIEEFVGKCTACVHANFVPITNETIPWKPTSHPWERIHIDFFFLTGVTFLICVDSYTKWIEVFIMNGTTAKHVKEKLSLCFATWGLPIELVSDNGPPFSSVEFLDFCTNNLIVASKSAPYHPQGNGLAERGVQTVKTALKKYLLKNDGNSMAMKLTNFLLAYRTTPSTVTRRTPAEMMLSYNPRSLVSAVRHDPNAYVPCQTKVNVKDKVWVRLSSKHDPFLTEIVKVVGPTLVQVFNTDNKVIQVSVNQLKLAKLSPETPIVTNRNVQRNDNVPNTTPVRPVVVNQTPVIVPTPVTPERVNEPRNVVTPPNFVTPPPSPLRQSHVQPHVPYIRPNVENSPVNQRILRPRQNISRPVRFLD